MGVDALWPLLLLLPFSVYFLGCFAVYAWLALRRRQLPFDPEMFDRGASWLLGKDVRQVCAWALSPIVEWLVSARVRPDVLTVLCLALCVAAGVSISLGAVTLGGVIGLCGCSLDYFDGRLARMSARVSRAGSFLDGTLDRYGEAAFLGGAALLQRDSPLTLCACMLALGSSGVVSYARAKAEALGIELRLGLMQRPERVLLFCFGACASTLLDGLLPPSIRGQHRIFAGVIWVLAILTTYTAVQRTACGFAELRRRE